jgi:hypothetical protein
MNRWILGQPKDLREPGVFQHLSLVAFFAWVGLGADGLSSSAYGPEEAFRALEGHTYLALSLGAATALTVGVLCSSYSRIIEVFPSGGGGYVVASKLLGERAGVISGCALLVDYVLTIAISAAAGMKAVFAFLPDEVQWLRDYAPAGVVGLLIVMNLRGVKESVITLTPIFLTFLVTHAVLLVGALAAHLGDIGSLGHRVGTSFSADVSTLGLGGLALIFARAYALGGGTYTGIEAVSNSITLMREPRVQTGKRTMALMGVSLAITAGGILLAYLLLDVKPNANGEPMNATLAKEFAGHWQAGGVDLGNAFVVITLLSEGALLFVAAQSGFVAGPGVMATMAIDSWFPHQLSALSEQLTIRNGIYLMGGSALATLLYARGDVHVLVVMYSINVFLTFTLSNLGMSRHWFGMRQRDDRWKPSLVLHAFAFALCAGILTITSFEKFTSGAWVTLLATSSVVAVSYGVRAHYRAMGQKIEKLNEEFTSFASAQIEDLDRGEAELDPEKPIAVVLVGSYSGLGIHTLMQIEQVFPQQFAQVLFASAAIVDSGAFKGASELESLRANTERDLSRYVQFARSKLGWAAEYDVAVGTDAVFELERLCRQIYLRFPRSVFFAGQLVVRQSTWWYRLLHNETAYAVQRRLQYDRLPMVILPTRVL